MQLENHSKEDVVRHLQTLHKNNIFVTLCGGDEQMTIKLRVWLSMFTI